MVQEEKLDLVLVPLGLAVLAVYHLWLLHAILRRPTHTVVGLNAIARKRWVAAIMAVGAASMSPRSFFLSTFFDLARTVLPPWPILAAYVLYGGDHQNTEKNGVLAVQTLRNNIMASTVLATMAITLVSVISVFIGATAGRSPSPSSSLSPGAPLLVYGSKTGEVFAVKYLAISLCFMLAFVCNVQAIRLYAHASFLVGLPPGGGEEGAGREEFAAHVARTVNRGSHSWSLGLRAFYVSLALFLWTFGPIPMLACSVIMCGLLYFLDTTSDHAEGTPARRGRETGSHKEDGTV